MKRFLVTLALLIVLAAVVAWLGSGWAITRVTRTLLPEVESAARARGLALEQLHFTSAGLQLPRGIVWRDWSLTVDRVPANPTEAARPPLQVSADAVRLEVQRWSDRTVEVNVGGISASQGLQGFLPLSAFRPESWDGPALQVNRLAEGHVVLRELSLRPPVAPALREAATGLAGFLDSGQTRQDLRFSGRLEGTLEHLAFSVRLETERREGVSYLRANRDDVAALATKLHLSLQPDEIEIVHAFPLRALTLLQVKVYAQTRARLLSRANPPWPEDATRHILWSYWLTRAFGPEFATRVTDAHEFGETGNTPEERAMDLKNNAVARGYVRSGLTESEVIARIRTDPAVVASPGPR